MKKFLQIFERTLKANTICVRAAKSVIFLKLREPSLPLNFKKSNLQ